MMSLPLLHRYENQISEKLSNLPKATKQSVIKPRLTAPGLKILHLTIISQNRPEAEPREISQRKQNWRWTIKIVKNWIYRKGVTFLEREQKEKARNGNDCWWNSEGTGLTRLMDYLIMNDFIGTIREDVILIYIHIYRT